MPQLKIWQKLTLAVLALSIIFAALLYTFLSAKERDVEAAKQAKAGTAYILTVRKVLQLLPQYEQQMGEKGDPSAAVKQIEDALRALEAVDQVYGAELQTKDHLATLNSKWQALKGQGLAIAPLERQALLTNALNATRQLIIQAGNNSQLLLAPDLATYYTVDLVLLSLPEQQDNLARLWQLAFNVAARHDLNPETRSRMLALIGKLRSELGTVENSLRYAAGNDQSLALQTLSLSSRESTTRTLAFLNYLENWLAQGESAEINLAELNEAGQKATAAVIRFWDSAHPVLDNLLQDRATQANQDYYFWSILGIGGWLAWLIFGWRLVLSFTRPLRQAADLAGQLALGKTGLTAAKLYTGAAGPLNRSLLELDRRLGQIQKMAEDIAGGNIAATVSPLSEQDTVGHSLLKMSSYLNEQARNIEQIAAGNGAYIPPPKSDRDRFGKAFELLLEKTNRLLQAQREHERTEQSILNLLAEVSEAATGDLTVEAEVRSDPTGAIADAFNLMIGKLCQIIYKVKDTTFLVNQSAVNIQLATDELAAGSENQANQLKGVALCIRDMSNLSRVVSEHAAQSAAVARRTFDSSRSGALAVKLNQDSLRHLREQIQETGKRIQRLGERSQEIVSSLQLIKDIANRTSMLALNASIQAGVNRHGSNGFVVVAEEIEGLAERTSNVTKQIATLTQAIQTDSLDIAAALEATNRDAISGSARSGEAAQALGEIEEVSDQMTRLIQVIWQATQKQTQGADEMAKVMREISRVTNRVQTGSQETASSVRQLVSLAEELRSSVITFRLPDKPAPHLEPLRLTVQTEVKDLASPGIDTPRDN